ncbi:MAG: glycosyltransferase family 2 protein, partial [Anaerovoracaceae bacterium]
CKVSIIVPIYNAERYLNKCVKSLVRQTLQDIEIILVNDGSTDKSLSMCNKYAQKDKRIRVIDKPNEGCILTRRRGVEKAKAKYIMHVDADDWVTHDAAEVLYEEAIKSGADVTVANQYKILSNTAFVRTTNTSSYFKENRVYEGKSINEGLTSSYLQGNPFPSSLCAKLYKKEILIHANTYLGNIQFLGEDLFYNMGVFLNAEKVSILKKPIYYYRAGGGTAKYMPYLFGDTVKCYETQKQVIEEYYLETEQKRRNGISIMLLNTLKTCLQNCFRGELSEKEIKKLILEYVSNKSIIEALNNEGVKRYFDEVYLKSINDKDISYLYKIGQEGNRQFQKRQMLIKAVSKLHL